MFWNLAMFTSIVDENVYSVVEKRVNLLPSENVLIEARIAMNLDMKLLKRSTFNFLNFFGAIGGIMSVITSTINLMLSIWNYKHLDNYLVSQLFRVRKRFEKGKLSAGFIRTKRFSNLLEYFKDLTYL